MLPVELEKLVLGTCIKFPNGSANIPQQVSYELDVSRFGDSMNAQVFIALKNCVKKNLLPNPANLALEMGVEGDIEYLESLQRFPDSIGVYDAQSIPDWVRKIDLAGRARLIHILLNKKIGVPVENFQKQILSSDDPDAYLSSLLSDINRYIAGSKTNYKPFSDAVEIFKERVKASLRGEVTEIIPCGIPSLEKYCIPRPRSFGVISGISGQGKTQFALYIAIGVAIGLKSRGERGYVAINTLEQQGDRLAMRIACMMSMINSLDIAQARITKNQADLLFEKCDFISSLPIVYNDDPTLTSSQFVSHAIGEHLKNPRVFGISDYVELFKDKAESEELRVSGATRNVRTVCWETGSCEVMIVQVNDSATSNRYKTGGMFSSRYSRSPAHGADWYVEVVNYPQLRKAQLDPLVPDHRNAELAYALIEKNKDYPLGEEPFEWVPEYTLFRDVSLIPGELYGEIKKEDDF